jgi:HAD superfamily hydrolase (TIGR01509 family)
LALNTAIFMTIRYLIFDLDGTLVDSGLDFDLMRAEMGLPHGAPILETLAGMEAEAARRCWQIVERHELAGAERAVPFPGVLAFLETLAQRGVRQAVLTRNSRTVAEAMLRRFPFPFDRVVTREEGPIKPDPQAVLNICRDWGASPHRTAIVGDSRYDLETGRRAGVFNVLYTAGKDVAALDYASWAHYVLHSFEQSDDFLTWLDQPA